MSNPSAAVPGGILDTIGNWILGADTRWVVICAGLLLIPSGIVLARQHRSLTMEGFINLSLTLAQLYSASAIFAVFVLTDPPALGKLDPFARQSAGFIAFIALLLGVIKYLTELFGRSKVPSNLRTKLEALAKEVSDLGGQSGDDLKKKADELAIRARKLAGDTKNLVAAAATISGGSG
jgi:hypothetical protein